MHYKEYLIDVCLFMLKVGISLRVLIKYTNNELFMKKTRLFIITKYILSLLYIHILSHSTDCNQLISNFFSFDNVYFIRKNIEKYTLSLDSYFFYSSIEFKANKNTCE